MRHLKCSLFFLLALPRESLGTPYSWVRYLKYSLCLFAVTTDSLGYTAVMGAQPKVQPISDICKLYQQNNWVTMYSRGLKPVFGSRSLHTKRSYSPFRQKSSFVVPKNFTPCWAPIDVRSFSIIEEVFARVKQVWLSWVSIQRCKKLLV